MIRGTAATAAHRALEAAIALFLVPFILHRLGYDAYGLWALFYSVTLYLNLADLGFAASLNRHFITALADSNSQKRYCVFSTGFAFMAVVAGTVFAAGILLERWFIGFFPQASDFGNSAIWVWRSLVLVLSLGFMTNYARALFFSTHRTGSLAILNMFLAVLNALTIVYVLSMGWGLVGLAGGAVAVSLVRFCTTLYEGASRTPGWKIGPGGIRLETLGKMWSFGIQVQVARIADVINQQFDRLILGRAAGLDNVTYYDVGAKAASTANLIPTTAYYVIEPAAATFAARGDTQRFSSLMLRGGKYMSLIAMPIGSYLLVATEPLLNLWLGSPPHEYMTLALRFLVVAYLCWTVTVPLRLCARGAGFPSWEAIAASIQAVLNVVLSISLYLLFGFIGVLAGTLIAAVTGQTIMTVLSLRGLKQPALSFVRIAWLGPLIPSVTGGVGAWIVLKWLIAVPDNSGRIETIPALAVSALVFSAVFIAVAGLIKVVTGEELKYLVRSLRREAN